MVQEWASNTAFSPEHHVGLQVGTRRKGGQKAAQVRQWKANPAPTWKVGAASFPPSGRPRSPLQPGVDSAKIHNSNFRTWSDPAQRRTKGGTSPAVRQSGPSPAVEGPPGPNVESRGRLLSAFGPPQISPSIWRRFCQDAKNSNCRTSSDPAQRRTKGGTSPAVLFLPGRRADRTM